MYVGKIKNAVNRFLEGSSDLFLCRFPLRRTRGMGLLLKILFSRIVFGKEQAHLIRAFPEDACIVYVNTFKSTFEYLFSYARFGSVGILTPTIAIGYSLWFLQPMKKLIRIMVLRCLGLFRRTPFPDLLEDDFLGQRLVAGEAVFLSLIEERDFYQRFLNRKTDSLTYLIDLQKTMERPVYIVPQVFFYTHKPASASIKLADIFFGSDQQPSGLRILFRALARPEKMFVELSSPVDLKSFLLCPEGPVEDSARAALRLRRHLLGQMARHRQSATGPMVKSFDEIKQSILTNDDLAAYMKTHARRRNLSLAAVRRQAVAYFDEIAARYRPGIIGLCVRIVQWLSETVFDGIEMDAGQVKAVKQMALKGPVIFVPCHRSHIDSMVMLYFMFQHHLSPPHFFAGKNLSFWPIGPLLRMTGAFFVRRSFRGAVFYTKVFSAYIYQLLKEGFHIAVFIEGTRSRTGKLLAPQLGMINILLNAFENKACADLVFVPVYIGYERVPEEKEYLTEMRGGAKTPESAGRLLKARKLLKTKYGKIYVKFNDPIALSTFIQDRGLSPASMSSKHKNLQCRSLAHVIMNEIDKATVVTPRSLVAAALLNSPRNRTSLKTFMEQVSTYISYLVLRDMPVSSSLTHYPRYVTARILGHYEQVKIIEIVREKPGLWQDGDLISIRKNRRSSLEYYKNNSITHFVPAAAAALTILARDAFLFQTADLLEDYRYLIEFFSLEFLHRQDQTDEFVLRKTIKAFIDQDTLIPHATLPDAYALTSPGLRKLKLFGAFLAPFFQSYSIVLRWLAQTDTQEVAPEDRTRKIMAFGRRVARKGEILQDEALSKPNFENALQYFNRQGVHGKKDLETIEAIESRIFFFMNALER